MSGFGSGIDSGFGGGSSGGSGSGLSGGSSGIADSRESAARVGGMSASQAASAAYRNELRRILWRPKYRIIIVIYAIAGLAAGVLGSSGFSLYAIATLSTAAARANVAFGALSAWRSFFLPLAAFMLAADVISHEIENKSIKCALMRPVSRLNVYVAKIFAMLTYLAIALAVGFVAVQAWRAIVLALSAASGGVAGAVSGGFSGGGVAILRAYASDFAEALVSYALTLAPTAAFVAFASMVAVVIRSPALVMFLCIGTYGALTLASAFLGGSGAAIIFTNYTGWYRMFLGAGLPAANLLTTVGLLASTCAIFFGLGFLAFDKKEI